MFGSGKKKDDKKKKVAVKKEDRYLGDVQGNIIDNYQNTSYNLKLYMIKAKTDNGGGWMNGAMAAEPQDTVVIAQTSVTGVQIDNLDMQFVQSAKTGNSTAVRAAFTLKQPGAADLLDQIQIAKMHLGHYMYADVPMFLEINFQGYEDDIDDADGGGKPVHVAGPYIYKLMIAKVSIAIDHYGSDYEFECPVGSADAYSDFHYKLPKDMSVQGDSIESMTQYLQDGIKKYKEDNLTEEDIHDEIVFDLSQVKQVIKNTSLVEGFNRGNRKNAEQVNRLINASSQGVKSKEDYEKLLEDNPDSLDGGITVESAGWGSEQQINMVEGTNMNQFFTTMFVMCDDFLEDLSRKKNFRDYTITEEGLDLDQTFVRWYRIDADVEYLEFDERRMKYARRVTYKPVIYETSGVPVSAAEANATPKQVTKRIREMNIKKAYHYLYTGLNDQVLNADIKFNAGQILLGAPGGGKMGDQSTNPNANIPNIPKNQDTTGKTDEAQRASDQSSSVSAFKEQISNDPGFQKRLQSDLRMSDDEFKDFKKDKERVNETAKAMAFTNYQQGKRGLQPSGNKSSGGGGTGAEDGPIDTSYQPEASGFIYSADLIDDAGGSETVIGQLSQSSASANTINAVQAAAEGKNCIEIFPTYTYGTHAVSTSGDTSDGTNAATLFGYMYQNANDAAILIELGLSVRGDPWYLGPPKTRIEAMKPVKPRKAGEEYEDSPDMSEDGIVFSGADNYFLFTMQTPRVRDPNIEDEDENSGYMTKQGTSFFISGVYQIVEITASFSGGEFKVDFDKAVKESSVPLSKFDMTETNYDNKMEMESQDRGTETERKQLIANRKAEIKAAEDKANAEAEAAVLGALSGDD